ncbi:type III secretion system cytoplasmic ring protein SctQ [Mailhella massiliensis]|uniref:type III secretion system cytoplasmic ring protein SctQ n=1 Tax=Mailhella massiliensis TaxID=1903261 RepID=UPI002353D7E8|nr:type III secretion system cytoplasmic ring protein SctQ [Mailhella massiliensis]
MAEFAYYPAYRAPSLPLEKASLQNSVSLRPCPWSTAFGAGKVDLTPLPDTPGFAPACILDLDMGGTLWYAELDDAALLLRHEVFTDDAGNAPDIDERTLPGEVRRALLESMLGKALAALREHLNLPVFVTDVRFSPAESVKVPFSLGLKAVLSACNGLPEQTLFLRLSPSKAEEAAVLADALRALPQRQSGPLSETLKAVPLEVVLESGYLFLKPEEVARLGVEDVLLPEAWTAPETLTLRILYGAGRTCSALCTAEGGNATLTSPLSEEAEPSMDSSLQNDIDIRLSFELDRRLITVGELEALTPGYTFSLNSDMQSPVTIRANGKAIARGRLVDMNGVLGVQIAETL